MNTKDKAARGKPKRAVTRRDFLRLLKIAGLEAALLAFGGGLYMYASDHEPSRLEVTDVSAEAAAPSEIVFRISGWHKLAICTLAAG